MAKKDVQPDHGKFKIKGKDGRDVTLEFVNSGDTDKHIVEELTDADLTDKLPSPPPTWQGQTINWFVNFNVYTKKNDGQKGGYSSVEYYLTLSLEAGKSLLFYYDGQVNDKTQEFRSNNRVKLNAGDPPGGYVP